MAWALRVTVQGRPGAVSLPSVWGCRWHLEHLSLSTQGREGSRSQAMGLSPVGLLRKCGMVPSSPGPCTALVSWPRSVLAACSRDGIQTPRRDQITVFSFPRNPSNESKRGRSTLLLPPPALDQWAMRLGSRHLSWTLWRGRGGGWQPDGQRWSLELFPNDDLIGVFNTPRALKTILGPGLS